MGFNRFAACLLISNAGVQSLPPNASGCTTTHPAQAAHPSGRTSQSGAPRGRRKASPAHSLDSAEGVMSAASTPRTGKTVSMSASYASSAVVEEITAAHGDGDGERDTATNTAHSAAQTESHNEHFSGSLLLHSSVLGIEGWGPDA